MKYIVISIVVFACFIGSCTDSKDAKASAYTLSNCAHVGSGVERCENEEVICYVLKEYLLSRDAVFGGVSCFRK